MGRLYLAATAGATASGQFPTNFAGATASGQFPTNFSGATASGQFPTNFSGATASGQFPTNFSGATASGQFPTNFAGWTADADGTDWSAAALAVAGRAHADTATTAAIVRDFANLFINSAFGSVEKE
ncbi:hypothetical protein [Arthrobacter sp. H14-L1]|uniref:hypothetical protein n=1 Tax=Arthrobacter sp. H14-L1 TaxID=2996697 RepID=UPI002270775D|nr:hypothetical protein [Arthrobacter sp. H14-L1]MCY0905571.1 hypothetical protein [Arthrobacter sp. H14-L1]